MEKFDYRNFGKFFNEIISNPEVVKKRDFLAERALDWFEISADDIAEVDKVSLVKDLYRYISLSYYMIFKDNEEASKTDLLSIRRIEKEFPIEVYNLNKNPESWHYLMTYYSGIVDTLGKALRTKDGKTFKELLDDGSEDAE